MVDNARPVPPPLLGIVGSTATGKSELAMAVARRIGAEILVADSRQVYRGMDIGTAKPDAAARAGVPHHLLDLADPNEPFTVADWVRRARGVVAEIHARGRLSLLVGGTGLYVAALVDGHDYDATGSDPELRRELIDILQSEGLPALVERLDASAPDVARSIDRRNPRRVVRALERAQLGGGSGGSPWRGAVTLVGLARPRDVLYRRIDERAAWLFANGLLAEVRALLHAGYTRELRPMTGHGYAEAMRHLAGEWSLGQAIDVTARRTRQYAKRQLTWFHRQARVAWMDAGDRPADDPLLLAEALRLLRGPEGHRLP